MVKQIKFISILLFIPNLVYSLHSHEKLKNHEINKKDCPGIVWYLDRDLDGYGDRNEVIESCERPIGYVENNLDCHDDPWTRGSLYFPGAKEPCFYDDYNCDGVIAQDCQVVPRAKKIISTSRDKQILTSFEAGHRYKVNKGGMHLLNDKSDTYPGLNLSQSAWIETSGIGLAKTLKVINDGPFDLSDQWLRLWIKIKNVHRLKDLSLYLGREQWKYYVRLHLHSNQGQKWTTENDWVMLSLSWNDRHLTHKLPPGVTLEDFLKNITDVQWKLVDNGSGPVRLHVNRISTMDIPRQKYPHGVISITFDDNWESQYLVARKKMDEYFFPATAYVILGFLDTPNFMTSEQVRELQNISQWEIGFHSFDPIMHLERYTHFPYELVERDIQAGRQWMWENGLGWNVRGYGFQHFAFPKGEFKQPNLTDVYALSRKYFSSSRSIQEKHSETWPPADPHRLRVIYVTAPESVEKIIATLESGIKAGEWMILVFHNLVETTTMNDQWEIDKFNKLVDYLATKAGQTPIRTVGDVLRELEESSLEEEEEKEEDLSGVVHLDQEKKP